MRSDDRRRKCELAKPAIRPPGDRLVKFRFTGGIAHVYCGFHPHLDVQTPIMVSMWVRAPWLETAILAFDT